MPCAHPQWRSPRWAPSCPWCVRCAALRYGLNVGALSVFCIQLRATDVNNIDYYLNAVPKNRDPRMFSLRSACIYEECAVVAWKKKFGLQRTSFLGCWTILTMILSIHEMVTMLLMCPLLTYMYI